MTASFPNTSTRRALCALLVLGALAALSVATAPATAAKAKSCGRQVLDDWYDGRIDGTYPIHCYDDAIEIIPRDLREYSSAEDDIRRAMTAALRGEKAPANHDPHAGGREPFENPDEPGPVVPPDEPKDPGDRLAAPETESASSVPIPLLILAGLALLLVAGGSAGYLIRRLQARRLT